jgi:hypothetical protein
VKKSAAGIQILYRSQLRACRRTARSEGLVDDRRAEPQNDEIPLGSGISGSG